MRKQRTIIEHGPRRLLLRPWRRICRCGLAAWPCPAVVMLERQARALPQPKPWPGWNAPTRRYGTAPLLTRGQNHRSRP